MEYLLQNEGEEEEMKGKLLHFIPFQPIRNFGSSTYLYSNRVFFLLQETGSFDEAQGTR